MRLVYVCSDFGIPPRGTKGAAVHLRAITTTLSTLGHEVLLLSPKGGFDNEQGVISLPPGGSGPTKETAKLLKRWLVDHGWDDGVAKEFRSLSYNAWVIEHAAEALTAAPPDAIVERLSLFGQVGIDLANAFDVPLVVEVNAVLTEEAGAFRSLHLRDLAKEMETRVLDRADAVIAVSSPLRDRLVERGVPRDRIHVVPNGADLAAFEQAPSREQCRKTLGLGTEFVVGFVGSLKAWHGVDLLLSAFQQLHREEEAARLAIVGAGPMEETLRERTGVLGLDGAVHFVGAVPPEHVPVWLRTMDVAVAPYPDMEHFYFSPIKLFEYMAAGTCVVASRIGQIAEIVEDGVTGMLCTPGDDQDLARTLMTLMRSGETRERLARNALDVVRQRYTWKHTATSVSDIVGQTIDARRRDARAETIEAEPARQKAV